MPTAGWSQLGLHAMSFLRQFLRWWNRSRFESLTLGELLKESTRVKREPCHSRTRNFDKQISGEIRKRLVCSRLAAPSAGITHSNAGDECDVKDDRVRLPTVLTDDGRFYYWVWCDVSTMLAEFPDECFIEFDACDLLKRASTTGFGISIQCGDGFRFDVAKEEVASILSEAAVDTGN